MLKRNYFKHTGYILAPKLDNLEGTMWGTERFTYKGKIIEIFENNGQYWSYVNGKQLHATSIRGQAIELCKQHIDVLEVQENK